MRIVLLDMNGGVQNVSQSSEMSCVHLSLSVRLCLILRQFGARKAVYILHDLFFPTEATVPVGIGLVYCYFRTLMFDYLKCLNVVYE